MVEVLGNGMMMMMMKMSKRAGERMFRRQEMSATSRGKGHQQLCWSSGPHDTALRPQEGFGRCREEVQGGGGNGGGAGKMEDEDDDEDEEKGWGGRECSKDGDEGKDAVEEGAGVGHQELLALHLQRRDEDLGRREAAPADDDRRDDYTHHASVERKTHTYRKSSDYT